MSYIGFRYRLFAARHPFFARGSRLPFANGSRTKKILVWLVFAAIVLTVNHVLNGSRNLWWLL